jgi:hypothetical protein
VANQAHLAKLKEGVELWNRWRDENPTITPDRFTETIKALAGMSRFIIADVTDPKAAIEASSACAPSIVAPGFSRAIALR